MNQLKYGQKLKQRRQIIGFSEVYVAKKLKISNLAIRSMEESNFIPTSNMIKRLSELYGLPKKLIVKWVKDTIQRKKIVIK